MMDLPSSPEHPNHYAATTHHRFHRPPVIGDVVIQTWFPVRTSPIPVGWTISKDQRFIWKVWTEGDIWPLYFDGAYIVLRPDHNERL
jgi:hypothetical protein